MKTMLMVLMLSMFLNSPSIYDFKVKGLTGGDINFSDYKGKKILIVNTASECGNTPQYADLELLFTKHKDKLVVIGFPANNFGSQEPGSNEQIAAFCKKNFGVSFPMAEKVSVKGDDIHPVFKWLQDQSREMAKSVKLSDSKSYAWRDYLRNPITWNFTKFLVNEKGELEAVFHNKTSPMSEEVLKHLN